jgi:hypothetical protein
MSKWPIEIEMKGNDLNGRVFVYKTLRSVMESCFGKFADKSKYKGYADGKKYDFKTVMKKYKKIGVYGYAARGVENGEKIRDIHLWASKKASILTLMSLVGHELGHLKTPIYKDIKKEENKAMKIGMTCMESLQVTFGILEALGELDAVQNKPKEQKGNTKERRRSMGKETSVQKRSSSKKRSGSSK